MYALMQNKAVRIEKTLLSLLTSPIDGVPHSDLDKAHRRWSQDSDYAQWMSDHCWIDHGMLCFSISHRLQTGSCAKRG